MQLSKFMSSNLDIISIYRSSPCNYEALNQNIEDLIDREKPQLVVGDFNYCYLNSSPNTTKQNFSENNFEQLIREPTHIEGNLIDRVHLRDIEGIFRCTVTLHSKYFTDHKGLAIIVKKGICIYFT